MGRPVSLRYTVVEDTGSTRDEISVRRDGRVVSRLDAAFGPRDEAAVYTVAWRSPGKRTTGPYSFRVRAWDGAGNASSLSCAAIELS